MNNLQTAITLLTRPLAFSLLVLAPSILAAQSDQPKSIVSQLLQRDLDAAMETLGQVVDRGITIDALGYSRLPSAAGGVYRALAQRGADEQYELLQAWSLPDGQRSNIRLLAIPVPSDAPPKVFARGIGERPRDSTFKVASVGPVPGFFCSGWTLAQAANEAGRLTQLKSKLAQLIEKKVVGANRLLMLAEIAGARGQLDDAKTHLQQVANIDSNSDLGPD